MSVIFDFWRLLGAYDNRGAQNPSDYSLEEITDVPSTT